MLKTESKRILIIEDEFPMRYLIERQLKDNGYLVGLAKDGADGLKLANLTKPDLVLLDVMMPGIDGFEVCTQIKSDPETAEIPVIFVTAYERRDYRTRAFAAGAANYLTKPFTGEELMDQITAVFEEDITYDQVLPDSEFYEESSINFGHVVTLYSPKGGVGTTTLCTQLAAALTKHTDNPVILIDLNLPLGGMAQLLDITFSKDILDLLYAAREHVSLNVIDQHLEQVDDKIHLIPAPGKIIPPETRPSPSSFGRILKVLTDEGYDVIIDIGSQLTELTVKALTLSENVFVLTSGRPAANEQVNNFLRSVEELGIEPRRVWPLINEIHGANEDVTLLRVPVARLPHAGETSETEPWLREQGLRKMVSLIR